MQVLDHEHQRPVGGQPLNHPEHQLEDSGVTLRAGGRRGRRAVCIQLGQQPRQLDPRRTEHAVQLIVRHLAHQRPQHIDHRAEWQALTANLDAAAGEHPRPFGARPRRGFLDEPGLTDPRFPAHEDDDRFARDR